MEIEYYKTKDARYILTIIRDDGTSTWTKLHPGLVDHDLAHYAVEHVLQMKNAFFGMINRGTEFTDFESKEKRPVLDTEAIKAEYLVNLIQTDYWNTGESLDIAAILAKTLQENGISSIKGLNDEKIEAIKRLYHTHIPNIQMLPIGGHFTLRFNLDN